jgi:hypothetical protein
MLFDSRQIFSCMGVFGLQSGPWKHEQLVLLILGAVTLQQAMCSGGPLGTPVVEV